MRRVLFDSDSVLRPYALILALLLVPALALGLASLGGWLAVAGIAVILAGCLAGMIRYG